MDEAGLLRSTRRRLIGRSSGRRVSTGARPWLVAALVGGDVAIVDPLLVHPLPAQSFLAGQCRGRILRALGRGSRGSILRASRQGHAEGNSSGEWSGVPRGHWRPRMRCETPDQTEPDFVRPPESRPTIRKAARSAISNRTASAPATIAPRQSPVQVPAH